MRCTKSVLLLVLMAVGLAQANPAEAVTISVLPGTQIVSSGSSVNVDIVIDGLVSGAAPSLGAYDLDLTFNPAVLSFMGVTWGTGLDILGLGSVRMATPGSGVLNLFEVSLDTVADLDTNQPAAFVLATIAFSAAQPGLSPLGVQNVTLGDGSGNALGAAVQAGSITVNAVPEPASVFLVLAGTAGFFWRRRHVARACD